MGTIGDIIASKAKDIDPVFSEVSIYKQLSRIADLCGWTLYIVPRWLFMIGFEYKVA